MEHIPFAFLSHEEFERLPTKERIEYLDKAIARLEDLKVQLNTQIAVNEVQLTVSKPKTP